MRSFDTTDWHNTRCSGPPNNGHVVECGGAPPLLGEGLRSSFKLSPSHRQPTESGGAPPHSTTQASESARHPSTRVRLDVFKPLDMTKNHLRISHALVPYFSCAISVARAIT